MSSIEENLLEYANVDYVFSNRLHVLLLALRAGVTPIALVRRGSNAKIRGLFSDMGLASHCFDVDEFLDINQILIKVGGKKESVRLAAERYDATRGRLNNGFERMVRG
jgi:polysaccharide pyruvyl transferase WcaK-like protein